MTDARKSTIRTVCAVLQLLVAITGLVCLIYFRAR
jgi:hypothetical protein